MFWSRNKNQKNQLKQKYEKCMIIWNRPITAHHLTSSSTFGSIQNARFSVLGLMFRSTVNTHFFTKINDSNHKSKFKVQTANYIILFTKFKMIDHRSRNQSKKIDKTHWTLKNQKFIKSHILQNRTNLYIRCKIWPAMNMITSFISHESNKIMENQDLKVTSRVEK